MATNNAINNTIVDTLLINNITERTVNFGVTFGSKILLPTSGGTASAFNYYEEGTHTTNWNGPWGTGASSIAGNVNFRRIGKLVTLNIPDVTGTSTGAQANITIATNLPSRLIPITNGMGFPIRVLNNNTFPTIPGFMSISSGGLISISLDYNTGTGFAAVNPCGMRNTCVTYLVA